MNTALATIGAEKYLVTYRKMQAAIETCHSVDECKSINDAACAAAVFYEKAKDDDAMRKFHEIKLRSWRRLGELLIPRVNFSGCETKAAQLRAARAQLANDPIVLKMTETELRHAIQLAALTPANFDEWVDKVGGSINRLIQLADPEYAEFERQREVRERARQEEEERTRPEREAREARRHQRNRLESEHFSKLFQADMTERRRLGLTLVKMSKNEIKTLVLHLTPEMHESLRTAAFRERITMNEVLRQAYRDWATRKGYPVAD